MWICEYVDMWICDGDESLNSAVNALIILLYWLDPLFVINNSTYEYMFYVIYEYTYVSAIYFVILFFFIFIFITVFIVCL